MAHRRFYAEANDQSSAEKTIILTTIAAILAIIFDGKKKKTDVIELTNQGQTELDISSLQMFTSGLTVSLGKSKLAPGQSTKLKVTAMRDELLKLRRRPRILMITNDPTQGKVVISINAK